MQRVKGRRWEHRASEGIGEGVRTVPLDDVNPESGTDLYQMIRDIRGREDLPDPALEEKFADVELQRLFGLSGVLRGTKLLYYQLLMSTD